MNGAELLKSKGITQADLERQLNCERNNVNIWFCGSHSPKVSTVVKLVTALNELGANTDYNEVYAALKQSREEYLERKGR